MGAAAFLDHGVALLAAASFSKPNNAEFKEDIFGKT
jgi:hypothetical protein